MRLGPSAGIPTANRAVSLELLSTPMGPGLPLRHTRAWVVPRDQYGGTFWFRSKKEYGRCRSTTIEEIRAVSIWVRQSCSWSNSHIYLAKVALWPTTRLYVNLNASTVILYRPIRSFAPSIEAGNYTTQSVQRHIHQNLYSPVPTLSVATKRLRGLRFVVSMLTPLST